MRSHKVGDVLTLVRRPVEVDSGRIYREIGIRSFGKGVFHKEPILGIALGNKRVFEIHPGELLFSNVFAWEGAVAVSTEAESGMIGSHRFMTYEVDSTIADIHYLKAYFQSEHGLALIRAASPGSAGRNKTLGIEAFASQSLKLPPVEEQQRISQLLSEALAKSSGARSMMESRQAAIPAAVPTLIDAIIDRYTSTIASVQNLAQIVNDTVHPGDHPGEARDFVGLEHIAQHLGIKLSSRPVGDETGRKFRFRAGDVLYGYLRPYQNKVWRASHPGLCSVEQFVLRADNPQTARYLGYVLRGRRVLDRVQALTNNLQLPRLGSKALLAMDIPSVPSKLMADALDSLDQLNDTAVRAWRRSQEAMTLIASLEPALLNAAFSGKL